MALPPIVLRADQVAIVGVQKPGRKPEDVPQVAEIVKSFPKNGDTPLFFKTEYVHPQNHQKYPMYLMNRDGFSLLAMGFTGKEAAQ